MKKRTYFLFILLLLLVSPLTAQAQSGAPQVILLEAEGPLTPAMANYLDRGLEQAAREQAALIILRLDTPGGSIDLMNRMVQSIRASQVPVIVYVAPNGAMAGSAGTLITMAGHKAAMAPETVIGAASPVGGQGEDIGETMESKVKGILKASARSLAQERGRGADAVALAEAAIDTGDAATASEALQAGLVDYIANDVTDLIRQLDGAQVNVLGQDVALETSGLLLKEVKLNWIEQALQLLTNPNIVFILLTVGVQAILIEFSTPGGWVAGFTGVVALLLAIYGLGILPVNWFGALFLVLAFVLFAVDVKAPTHGALTFAGLAAFVAGALILFNSTPLPGFPRVSVPLVIGTGLLIAASFSVIIGFALRALRIPAAMGQKTLIGRTGITRGTLDPHGTVYLGGEMWSAQLSDVESSLPGGVAVEVVALDGLRLIVRPLTTTFLPEQDTTG